MNRRVWIFFALAATASIADFLAFYWIPELEFHVHNMIALLCGVAMIAAAAALRRAESGAPAFRLIVLLIGLWMALAHVVKLAVGTCI